MLTSLPSEIIFTESQTLQLEVNLRQIVRIFQLPVRFKYTRYEVSLCLMCHTMKTKAVGILEISHEM
jgi:hypothetical protein